MTPTKLARPGTLLPFRFFLLFRRGAREGSGFETKHKQKAPDTRLLPNCDCEAAVVRAGRGAADDGGSPVADDDIPGP